MGCVENITCGLFPKQGIYVNKRVEVCFHYDTDHMIYGTLVRDDYEKPWAGIIQLDDGRFILTHECQYSIIH